jgi:hypothetical protein
MALRKWLSRIFITQQTQNSYSEKAKQNYASEGGVSLHLTKTYTSPYSSIHKWMRNGEVMLVSLHASVFLLKFYLTTPPVGKTVERSVVEWSVKHTEMRDHTPISSMFTILAFTWRDSSKLPETPGRIAGLEFRFERRISRIRRRRGFHVLSAELLNTFCSNFVLIKHGGRTPFNSNVGSYLSAQLPWLESESKFHNIPTKKIIKETAYS